MLFPLLFIFNNFINNLDRTCVLIGIQVCFHRAMKHENDVSNWLPLYPSCEKLQFHERNLSIHIYLFVKTKNNNSIKEINMLSVPS